MNPTRDLHLVCAQRQACKRREAAKHPAHGIKPRAGNPYGRQFRNTEAALLITEGAGSKTSNRSVMDIFWHPHSQRGKDDRKDGDEKLEANRLTL